ncbi:hypothetical protein AB0Q95_18815 [Streptomyces sp. NPDC059900]|uniref:hypothetical protein n=1 Tax=Streptomyces sp. NPDC059900 TaxID=3155816 RepID=UPI003414F74B
MEKASLVNRITATKAAKGFVVAALTATTIGLTAPISSASHESSWADGCRGYWYSTSGHGYCKKANTWYSSGWYTDYNCNNEVDTQHYDTLENKFKGKYDTSECTFKINKTDVHK